MKSTFFLILIASILLSSVHDALSQDVTGNGRSAVTIIDSLKSSGYIFNENRKEPDIKLTRDQAIRFLQQRTRQLNWSDLNDPLRKALNQLVFEASHARFDSVKRYLQQYSYDSVMIPWEKFYIWEPLRLKIPVASVPEFPMKPDTAVTADTTYAGLPLVEPFRPEAQGKVTEGLKDTTIMVVIDTLSRLTAGSEGARLRYFDYPYQGDSLRIAVMSLVDFLETRDSVMLNFTGASGTKIPVWLGSRKNESMRYWLRNEFADSVTVWIGCEDKNTISLYLEQGINFRKPARQDNYSEAKINVQAIDKSKLLKQQFTLKKDYWKYRTESSLIFSQAALSNWVKGGENSVSTTLDVTGYADFKRPDLKLSSNNFARLKLGFMKTGGQDIRKNLDLLETNSKLNHKAFGKFDFSAIMLFKTQVAIGKLYTKDDTLTVSNFLNPAILTIGIGLDYKPDKETSYNFSPLSYKGTFVPAGGKVTADEIIPGKLDQTRYGIPIGRKSLNEPGASFMISKISHPFKDLTVTNRLQLFTNYIHNPLNIDVDWEMIAVYNLNWFTDLRLNTHLIYDDDTKTPVMNGKETLKKEDGTVYKTARAQFKEMFGVSLMFKF